MNKGELIKAVAAKAGMAQKEAGAFFEAYFEVITKELKAGKKVVIPGFGTYEVRKRAARVGINPATKAKIKIAAAKVPVFKFGKSFKGQF